MSPRALHRLLPFVLLLSSACASTGQMTCPASAAPPSSWIGSDELLQTRGSDLYEALLMSRPRFLQPRDAQHTEPVTYVNGVRIGEVDALRAIMPSEVVEVRFLSGPDATTRYGTDHVGGALLVRTVFGPTLDRCGR